MVRVDKLNNMTPLETSCACVRVTSSSLCCCSAKLCSNSSFYFKMCCALRHLHRCFAAVNSVAQGFWKIGMPPLLGTAAASMSCWLATAWTRLLIRTVPLSSPMHSSQQLPLPPSTTVCWREFFVRWVPPIWRLWSLAGGASARRAVAVQLQVYFPIGKWDEVACMG